jgi:hypothetical protein
VNGVKVSQNVLFLQFSAFLGQKRAKADNDLLVDKDDVAVGVDGDAEREPGVDFMKPF